MRELFTESTFLLSRITTMEHIQVTHVVIEVESYMIQVFQDGIVMAVTYIDKQMEM